MRPCTRRLALFSVSLMCLGACGGRHSTPNSEFDRQRAWAALVAQCDFGPRVPGSQGHTQCGAWIESRLREAGWHVRRDPFRTRAPLMRREVDMFNLVASRSESASPFLAVSAHWDSRARADEDPSPANRDQPVLGANDGASGVAVLLELARCLADEPAGDAVALLFWDGEDQGVHREMESWCLGSRHFAADTMEELGWSFTHGINLDMVGDTDLQLRREGRSNRDAREWTDQIWRVGQEWYPDVYADELEEVYDDHVPFLARGIPYVDIIDIDYSVWHTLLDNPEHCDAKSLGAAGEVVLEVVRATASEGLSTGNRRGDMTR